MTFTKDFSWPPVGRAVQLLRKPSFFWRRGWEKKNPTLKEGGY
jgi:hypothetical protein